jgi:hypothetical protein
VKIQDPVANANPGLKKIQFIPEPVITLRAAPVLSSRTILIDSNPVLSLATISPVSELS